jgi:hypothetical protein
MSLAEIVPSFTSFTQLLDQARAEVERIESVVQPAVFRALLPVADILARAKDAYEHETGTGHGRRNPDGHPPFRAVAAAAIERSESFVERLVQLSRLDEQTRDLVAERVKLVRNQDALLALAREPSTERRRLAVEAFDAGGRPAFDGVLGRLVGPVILEEIDEGAVTGFLTTYTEAKAAAIEARKLERAYAEPKALARRRNTAEAVFAYLASGEHKIDDAARERMGVSKAACKRALDDLRACDLIQSTSYLDDTFEVFDGRDLSQLVLDSRKPRVIVVIRSGEPPVTRKVAGGEYEFTAVTDGNTIRVTLRGV